MSSMESAARAARTVLENEEVAGALEKTTKAAASVAGDLNLVKLAMGTVSEAGVGDRPILGSSTLGMVHDSNSFPERQHDSFGRVGLWSQERTPNIAAPLGRGSASALEALLASLKSEAEREVLPHTRLIDPATERFTSTTPIMWDAARLQITGEQAGNKLVDMKQFINTDGAPAKQYLSDIMNANDITIVGEMHTRSEPSAHRMLGAEAIKELPEGSTLAIELPKSLRPAFEEFNRATETESILPSKFADMLSMQSSLSLSRMRGVESESPEYVDMLNAARTHHVRVVPIDVEPDVLDKINYKLTAVSPDVIALRAAREEQLASELLNLKNDSDKPVVGWLGNAHASMDEEEIEVDSVAQRIAKSAEVASGQRKFATVGSQVSEEYDLPLGALSEKLKQPVGVPVVKNGEKTILAELELDHDLPVSGYDHLMLYPPLPQKDRVEFKVRAGNNLLKDMGVNLDLNTLPGPAREQMAQSLANIRRKMYGLPPINTVGFGDRREEPLGPLMEDGHGSGNYFDSRRVEPLRIKPLWPSDENVFVSQSPGLPAALSRMKSPPRIFSKP